MTLDEYKTHMMFVLLTTDEHIPPNYKYIAVDDDGSMYAFIEKPQKHEHIDMWEECYPTETEHKRFIQLLYVGSLPPHKEWYKTLVML